MFDSSWQCRWGIRALEGRIKCHWIKSNPKAGFGFRRPNGVDGRRRPGWSPGGRTDGTGVKPGRTDGRSPGEARTDGWTEPGWSPRGRTPEPGWSSDGGRTFWGLVNRLRCWFGWMMETDWIGCWIRIDPLGWFLWFFWFFFAVFWNKFSGGSNIDGKDLLHIRGQLRRSVIGK